jgi:nitrogen-specific signal transduction histidine kinase
LGLNQSIKIVGKKMQRNLKNQTRNLEESFAIEMVVNNIAHDIQTPLAILQMLLIPISKSIPENQYKILNDAIHDLHAIANNLKKYYGNYHAK